jgi:hypothetical protein
MHLSSAVAEEIFTSHCWSVQPCVRPVSAAHRAAGDNALRGSVLPASGFRTCRRAGICDLLRRNDPGIESRAASTKLQTESVADLASLRSRLWDLLANGQAVRYPDASFGDPISVSRSFDVTLTSGQRGAFSAMRRISAARYRGLGPLAVTVLSIALARRCATTPCAAVQSTAALFCRW